MSLISNPRNQPPTHARTRAQLIEAQRHLAEYEQSAERAIKVINRLAAALDPFRKIGNQLYRAFEGQPAENGIIQIGGCWLTWGDFRRAIDALPPE